MAFTVNDYQDLIRLLAERPEWQAELRQLLLSDDFLALPVIVRELAEAQRELTRAQQHTEQALARLSRQVGSLSETFGGDIEDVAATVLAETLRRELGLEVLDLRRTWVDWDGEEHEIDVFGQARDLAHPPKRVWIVAEAKHNLTRKEVERFARVAELARDNLEGEVLPVCFSYRARPEVQGRVRELGLRLVFSYGRLV